ncbi:MAG: EpsG family protein [Sphingomicrobium sp.]
MLIYWSLFLLLTAGTILTQANDEPRSRLFFVTFASIPTVLMIGLRWKIGPDWTAYVEIFQYSQLFSLTQALFHADPAFSFLCWLLGHVGLPFWVLNLVCGIIFVNGLTAFCLRQPNPWLAFLVAFPYLVIVIGMSGARQSVALGFLFFALNAFADLRIYRLCILIFIGALFHGSAMLMLPLVLYSLGGKSLQRLALLALAGIIFVVQFEHTFSVYAVRYSSVSIQSGGLAYRLAMNGFAAFLFFAFRRNLNFSPHESRLWSNVSLCTLALALLALRLPSSTAVDRFLLYLFPLQFAVLSRLPETLGSRRGPSLVTAAVIGYAALVQITFLNFGTFSTYYVPYRSIFGV